jgi:serine/threonine-protein kinase RsbW
MKTELRIPSDLKYLSLVEHWLLTSLEIEFNGSIDWPRQSSRFRLALVEAYSNVVRHAHKDRPDTPVLLRLELNNREVTLEIWDYGKGYDISGYASPSPEDKQEGGYGWLIIKRLMDSVEYCLKVDGGNCLKLQANLPTFEPLHSKN